MSGVFFAAAGPVSCVWGAPIDAAPVMMTDTFCPPHWLFTELEQLGRSKDAPVPQGWGASALTHPALADPCPDTL